MPTLPPIPPDARLPFFLALLGLGLLSWLVLYLQHWARNQVRAQAGLPTKTLGQHLQTRAGHHVPGLVLVLVGVAVLAGVGVGYVLVHRGGASVHLPHPIVPPAHPRGGGTSQGYVSPDLAAYTRPADYIDQQATTACCAIATVRLDALNRAISRGEYMKAEYPASGYKICYYVNGSPCMGQGTNPADDAAAMNRPVVGAEPVRYWGPAGVPDSNDPAHTTPVSGARIDWVSYVDPPAGIGRRGLDDLEWRLDHKQPVGILWQVHHDGDAARGVLATYDGGGFAYAHCVVAVRWAANVPGIGEAVQIWNSYGLGYGLGGLVWLPAAVVMSHVNGTFVETPGAPVPGWLPPSPTAMPRATSTPRPAATPTRTVTPVPCRAHTYYAPRGANARTVPRLAAAPLFGIGRGQKVVALCESQLSTAHWLKVIDAKNRIGWVLRSALR